MKSKSANRTAQARSLVSQLRQLGVNLALPNGESFGHVHALNVLARIEGFEAHSHKMACSKEQTPKSEPVASQVKTTVGLKDLVEDWLDEHKEAPEFPRMGWQLAVENDETRLGYVDWLINQLQGVDAEDLKGLPYDSETLDFYYALISAVFQVDKFAPQEPAVRLETSTGESLVVPMEVNLSGRWADFNPYMPASKPALVALMLTGLKNLSLLLTAVTYGEETCFVGSREGALGVYVEIEYATQETELERGLTPQEVGAEGLKNNAEAVPWLVETLRAQKLHEKFPDMQFSLANFEDYSAGERHALLGFIPLQTLRRQDTPQDIGLKVGNEFMRMFTRGLN